MRLSGAGLSLVAAPVMILLVASAGWRADARRGDVDPPRAALPVVERLEGRLAPSTWERIRSLDPASGNRLLIVLRAADIETCEDLGRQLREAVHRGRRAGFVPAIAATPDDAGRIRIWARRERLVQVPVVAVNGGVHVGDRRAVEDPAVLLLDTTGAILRGVAHPSRVANVRSVSFASELNLE